MMWPRTWKDLSRTGKTRCWSFTPRTMAKFPRASGKSKEELEDCASRRTNRRPGQPVQSDCFGDGAQRRLGRSNVITIVGLRPFSSKQHSARTDSGPRPAQMYRGSVEEYVSIVGTDAFMEFVESSRPKASYWNTSRWAKGPAKTPLVVEVDKDNERKTSTARHRNSVADARVSTVNTRTWPPWISSRFRAPARCIPAFSEDEQREIVFKDITTGEVTHTTILDTAGMADYRA